MRIASRGVADMWFAKQGDNHLWLLLTPIQMAPHHGHEFGAIVRPTLTKSVGLAVLIEPFIGVQLRAVPWHPNQSQSRRVGGGNRLAFLDWCTGCPSTIR